MSKTRTKKNCAMTVCPFFKFCKYGHDLTKCKHNLSSNPDDVEVSID